MKISKRSFVFAALALTVLASCSVKSDAEKADDARRKANPNRVDWAQVPSEYNPKVDTVLINTLAGVESVKVDLFGFDKDAEVLYESTLPADRALVRIYKVFRRSASWGNVDVRQDAAELKVNTYGQYQCSIKTSNGRITELDGGCYVRVEVVLPVGAEVEVYNAGSLISRRFKPITTLQLLVAIKDASFAREKLAVIETFLDSYSGLRRVPSLTSAQLEKVVDQFMGTEDKLASLGRLHNYVSDRENLPGLIDREFSYFDQNKARAVVGLPEI